MANLTQIQLRRGLAALWTADNPVLASGEFGYETDTRKFKIGDGATPWAMLPYNGSGTSGGLSANGTRSSPRSISAAGGISPQGVARELQFVVGAAAGVVVTASPAIAAGTAVGQELILQGTDNTNSVQLNSGTGLDLNGSIILKANSRIYLVWDGTNWGEVSRK